MRILLDECVPKRLKRHLKGHNALTVAELGWAGKKNGELIRLMLKHNLQAFLTIDQNLSYQQNLREAGVIVVVMSAGENRMDDLRPLIPRVLAALDKASPDSLIIITK